MIYCSDILYWYIVVIYCFRKFSKRNSWMNYYWACWISQFFFRNNGHYIYSFLFLFFIQWVYSSYIWCCGLCHYKQTFLLSSLKTSDYWEMFIVIFLGVCFVFVVPIGHSLAHLNVKLTFCIQYTVKINRNSDFHDA